MIKTFVPGFVWAFALLVIVDGYIYYTTHERFVAIIVAHSEAVVFSGIMVLSVIMGLISNTLAFSGISDLLVRRPVSRDPANTAFFEAKRCIEDAVRRRYVDRIAKCHRNSIYIDSQSIDYLRQSLDADYLIIHEVDIPKIVYVQEQYWYYMELDVNLAISVLVLLAAYVGRSIMVGANLLNFASAGFVLVSVLFTIWLIRVARINYLRHAKKMLSLLCSSFDDNKERLRWRDPSSGCGSRPFPTAPARATTARSVRFGTNRR